MATRIETPVLALGWLGVVALVVWLSFEGAWVGATLAVIVLTFVSYLLQRSLRARRSPTSLT